MYIIQDKNAARTLFCLNLVQPYNEKIFFLTCTPSKDWDQTGRSMKSRELNTFPRGERRFRSCDADVQTDLSMDNNSLIYAVIIFVHKLRITAIKFSGRTNSKINFNNIF